ncbi:MAG: hypothetical protein LBF59_10050 [Prevotellaceae bacterium]|jgi:hypothetical protein|nr:hypothetical protein [Prevotellaceae bacterium]
MKTSNILVITYLSLIFGGLAVLYFDDMRHFLKYGRETRTNVVKLHESKVDLPQFTVIVDTTGYSFSVTSGENNHFSIVKESTAEISPEICNVRNDTLFINRIPKNSSVKIVCKDIKAIVAKNSEMLSIKDLTSDMLYLKLEKARSSIKNVKIGAFSFDLSNETHFDASNITVEVLNGKLFNSYLNIYSSKIRRSSIEQLDEKKHNMFMH